MLKLLSRLLHRKTDAPKIDDALWHSARARLSFLANMPVSVEQELRPMCEAFLRDKVFSGAQGFEPDNLARLCIAMQACLPVLKIGLRAYAGWSGIVVYPGEFVIPRQDTDEAGVMHEYDEAALGEAWPGGPVILSWFDDPADYAGANVVIHEFAHKLDLLDGEANGCPPLPGLIDYPSWQRDFRHALSDLRRRIDHGEDTALDPCAAEDEAEFFAVTSEAFFTDPLAISIPYPAIYSHLRQLYGSDPLAWQSAPGKQVDKLPTRK